MSQEGGIKNPRAKALWDKWRHVWMMAWERDRRLRDKLNYLQVEDRVSKYMYRHNLFNNLFNRGELSM